MNRRNESYAPLLCSYPDSEKINSVSEGAEAMFCRLLAKCDDDGNYHGEPKRLLGKLFTLRYENGSMDVKKVVTYCNELVTATLITRYVSVTNPGQAVTVTYIHINEVKKSLRTDVKKKLFFPEYTPNSQVTQNKELNETVTARNESGATRNETLPPIQSNPIQSNPIQSKPTQTNGYPLDFLTFWKKYPRKVGKGAAHKSWKKAIRKISLEVVLQAVSDQKLSEQWLKEGGKYIPNPATWLNQERWGDELKRKDTLEEVLDRAEKKFGGLTNE